MMTAHDRFFAIHNALIKKYPPRWKRKLC
jgi:hypothetical protein